MSLVKNQKGQALLIVVLIMVIALTVGLSVVSRSITNLRTSTEQASSQKALAAAEAGIEQALQTNTSVANNFTGNSNYNTVVTQEAGNQIKVNGESIVPKNDAVYIWLNPNSTPQTWTSPWPTTGGLGTLKIYWGSSTDECPPTPSTKTLTAALEISLIYGTRANPIVKRYAVDPCPRGNNFDGADAGGTILDKTYPFSYTISSISQGLLVRVMPLYASTYVAADGGSNALPLQGYNITSTGTSENTTRKISVFKPFPELPTELFPYGLFVPVDE